MPPKPSGSSFVKLNSKQREKYRYVMNEFKKGTLKHSNGKIVKTARQARAIAFRVASKV